MVRLGVIFGLVFQSLVLMWCATPSSLATTPAMGCCESEAGTAGESCCCCEESGKAEKAADTQCQSLFAVQERCCQCPLTVEEPRIPAYPVRPLALELSRVPAAVISLPASNTPQRIGLEFASVPAMLHPPDSAGRSACERFCRWTI